MDVLHDNLNEDSASTFSSVFSSSSSSFHSDSDSSSADSSPAYEEPAPRSPTSVQEANALFEHNLAVPLLKPARPHARRVSFAAPREPSLNHDVEEIASLNHSPANAATALPEPQPHTSPSPACASKDQDGEDDGCGALALPVIHTSQAAESLPHTVAQAEVSQIARSRTSPNASITSLGVGAVEQAPVNAAQAGVVKKAASLMSAKTLSEYRHLKYVLRQRLLRRYYDLWQHWARDSPKREGSQNAERQLSVSTQTLSIDDDVLRFAARRPSPRTGARSADRVDDPNWNADVESLETLSVIGSSLSRQSVTPRTSASRGSSPGNGGGTFVLPPPLGEPACLGATSRPSRLVDYGAHSDRPRPKGPQQPSLPSTGLPSVVEDPIRVTHIR